MVQAHGGEPKVMKSLRGEILEQVWVYDVRDQEDLATLMQTKAEFSFCHDNHGTRRVAGM